MAQNVTLWGANYSNVPSIIVPKTGGGSAQFYDVSGTTAQESDVSSGKTFLKSDGSSGTGSLTFVTYYVGSGNPSSSLGSNGDIYLKTT